MVTFPKPTVQPQKQKHKQNHKQKQKNLNICSEKKNVTNVTKRYHKKSNNREVLKTRFDYARMLRYKTLPCYQQKPTISYIEYKTRLCGSNKVTK